MLQGANSCDFQKSVPGNLLWNTRFKSCAFAPGLAPELCEAFCQAEELLQASSIVKNSRSTTAGIFSLNGKDYFIKRSNVNSFCERIKRIGRMPRPERNKLVSDFLAQLGIRVPEVFMTMATYPGKLPGAGYLITEAFPHPMTVSNNMPRLLEFYGSSGKVIEVLAAMAHKIHDAGVEHGDFKMNNILFADNQNGSFELGLFDFDGTILHNRSCSRKERGRELARMASSYFLRGCELGFYAEADAVNNLREWAKAYAACGKWDFMTEKTYLARYSSFLAANRRKG